MKNDLQNQFGNIDIYLFDQLLKGTFENCTSVLDAGCGYGRNLVYFLKQGYDVFGIDANAEAILEVQKLAEEISSINKPGNFRVEAVEEMSFADSTFDLVISSAVFHFAKDEAHFNAMVQSCWRVLKPGGFLFARLASNIGIEQLIIPTTKGRYILPDQSERYLVTLQQLLSISASLKGQLWEPIKTTNVQNLRCMTTWCLHKPLY